MADLCALFAAIAPLSEDLGMRAKGDRPATAQEELPNAIMSCCLI